MAVHIVMWSLLLVGAGAADCTSDQTCEALATTSGADKSGSTQSLSMLQSAHSMKTGDPYVDKVEKMKQAIDCAQGQNCGAEDILSVTKDYVFGYAVNAAEIARFGKIGSAAQGALKFGEALHALLDMLTETASTKSTISIHNRLTAPLKIISTRSYQMNLWDDQFPDVGPWVGLDVHTWTSGNTRGWGDTNAEAQYKVWCPQLSRDVKFTIMIRHQKWIRFKWDDQDVYNPCYDMWIEGWYYTPKKDDTYSSTYHDQRVIASSSSPILVVGSAEVPNKKTKVTLKLKPHVADSRFPVLYEHSNFHGVAHPIKLPYVRNLQGFNDKASSLRVPPGMLVSLCEHEGFGGQCPIFSDDTASIPMNDAATSAIWIVDLPWR